MTLKSPIVMAAAALMLVGAGCDLSEKVSWLPDLPFGMGGRGQDSRAMSESIDLEPGLSFTVRPSALGLSGSVDELLGSADRAMTVTVKKVEPERSLSLAWKSGSSTGTLALGGLQDARSMLLPAFWGEGDIAAGGNGGLWLSRAAYDDLNALGKTEWRLGLAEGVFAPLEAAFKKFNDMSVRIFGSATDTGFSSPFGIRKTAVVETYPLKVDGRIVLVRAIKASGWFAEFLILDNQKNPLILKATVNPLAAPALAAFETVQVRWKEAGYEVTSISNP